MQKISVIVPIYNIENYVRSAVDSILRQSYTNLEILLVDDGSTDSSGMICDEYAQKDARVKVIHKKNGGLSDARNAGIEAATGTYIGFVDGDDFIEPEMYRRLYDALVKNNADFSICSFRFVGAYENRNGKIEIDDEVLSGKEILLEKRMSKHAWGWGYAWNKLYKKEVFQSLRYPVGKAYEDDFILQDLYWNAERVACIAYVGYNYVQRGSSISNAMRENRMDEIDSRLRRDLFYERHNVPADVRHKNIMRAYNVLYLIYAHTAFTQEPFASRIRAENYALRQRNKKMRRESLTLPQKAELLANYISPYYTWKCMQLAKKILNRSGF